MTACVCGHTTIVSMLLDFMRMSNYPGVHPYIDCLGCTPLFMACSNNQIEVLKLLLMCADIIEMLNVPNVVSGYVVYGIVLDMIE